MSDEYPRFSDFADESTYDGDKKRIDDLLNHEILILKFKVKNSIKRKDTTYTTIHLQIDETNFVLFTGSKVILDQLEKYKDQMPFYATIKKIDQYYTFT